MITAILTMAVFWCMFYGRLPPAALAPLCIGIGLALALLGRHNHTQFLKIDVFAQVSRLNRVNPALKFWTALVLMVLCISARSPLVGLFLTLAIPIFIVHAGGLSLHDYVRMLTLPVSFLMLSGLALLFEVTSQRTGVIGIPALGFWLCVGTGAQTRAALVMGRALGALSCLYLLSLTTPMSEIIGVLRRVRCPDVLTGLMYLIYRYIFILLSMHHTMRAAAKSRLGYIDYRASVRTTGNLYANLLSRSYRQANRNFDAMESRLFDMEIRFLEHREKITGAHAAAAAGITIITAVLTVLLGWST